MVASPQAQIRLWWDIIIRAASSGSERFTRSSIANQADLNLTRGVCGLELLDPLEDFGDTNFSQ
jgi:hypothetical protein